MAHGPPGSGSTVELFWGPSSEGDMIVAAALYLYSFSCDVTREWGGPSNAGNLTEE